MKREYINSKKISTADDTDKSIKADYIMVLPTVKSTVKSLGTFVERHYTPDHTPKCTHHTYHLSTYLSISFQWLDEHIDWITIVRKLREADLQVMLYESDKPNEIFCAIKGKPKSLLQEAGMLPFDSDPKTR